MARLKFPPIRCFIGHVRDYAGHAAATKIVPTAEYNPFECIKINIYDTPSLIDLTLVTPASFTSGRADTPLHFEIKVRLRAQRYAYRLELDLPRNFRKLRMLKVVQAFGRSNTGTYASHV